MRLSWHARPTADRHSAPCRSREPDTVGWFTRDGFSRVGAVMLGADRAGPRLPHRPGRRCAAALMPAEAGPRLLSTAAKAGRRGGHGHGRAGGLRLRRCFARSMRPGRRTGRDHGTVPARRCAIASRGKPRHRGRVPRRNRTARPHPGAVVSLVGDDGMILPTLPTIALRNDDSEEASKRSAPAPLDPLHRWPAGRRRSRCRWRGWPAARPACR
jgi:hypothetical protein